MTISQTLPERVQRAIADPYVSMRTAQELLGFSRSALDRFVRQGKLHVHRVGLRGNRRVRLSELKNLLGEGEVTK